MIAIAARATIVLICFYHYDQDIKHSVAALDRAGLLASAHTDLSQFPAHPRRVYEHLLHNLKMSSATMKAPKPGTCVRFCLVTSGTLSYSTGVTCSVPGLPPTV